MRINPRLLLCKASVKASKKAKTTAGFYPYRISDWHAGDCHCNSDANQHVIPPS